MSDYFNVHCPECGNIFSADQVNYSLGDIVVAIAGENPSETSVREFINAGNIIDYKRIKELVIDNSWLWDMRRNYLSRFAGPIELKGQTIIDFLVENNYDEDGAMPKISINADTDEIADSIHALISQEKAIRATRRNAGLNVKNVISNVIEYAKSGEILFKGSFMYREDTDTNGMFLSRGLICSENWQIDKKKCPKCGHKFSKWAGMYEEKVISVIGTPYVGKTAYFTSVINSLNRKGAFYNISVTFDQGTDDYKEFKKNIDSYNNGFAISKTQTTETPQISVKILNTLTNKEYLYTFVDIPGELFLDSSGSSKNINDNRKIIKHSDVIWLCISADQAFNSATIDEMDKDKNKITELNIENQTDKDLDNIAMNIETFVNELFNTYEERPAVALIITKCDQISKAVFEKYGDDKKIYDDLTRTICAPMARNSVTGEIEPVNIDNAGEPVNNWTYEKVDTVIDKRNVQLGCYAISRFKLRNQNIINKFFKDLGDTIEALNMVKFKLANAFSYENRRLTDVPVFFVASYGRKAVTYNPGNVLYSLLENSPKFKEEFGKIHNVTVYFNDHFSYDNLSEYIYKYSIEDKNLDSITKERVRAFLEMCESNQSINNFILKEYMKFNPLYKFGLFNPAFWALAYTGLIDCAKAQGETWILSDNEEDNKNQLMLYEEFNKGNDEEDEHKKNENLISRIARIFKGKSGDK